MKKIVLAAALALSGALFAGQAQALPATGPSTPPLASDVQEAQFIFGGRNYCWYDAGWHGPGFYWCGYAFRRGLGWGGGRGFHGWNHRGGRVGIHRGRVGNMGINRGRVGTINRGARIGGRPAAAGRVGMGAGRSMMRSGGGGGRAGMRAGGGGHGGGGHGGGRHR